jgi:hypothetical protein
MRRALELAVSCDQVREHGKFDSVLDMFCDWCPQIMQSVMAPTTHFPAWSSLNIISAQLSL